MFVKFGDTLINADLVRSVRWDDDGDGFIVYANGDEEKLADHLDSDDVEDRLLGAGPRHVIPAPNGWKRIVATTDVAGYVNNSVGEVVFEEEPILAFLYPGGGNDIIEAVTGTDGPILAYGRSAVVRPDGMCIQFGSADLDIVAWKRQAVIEVTAAVQERQAELKAKAAERDARIAKAAAKAAAE